jgi:hypothetical protein
MGKIWSGIKTVAFVASLATGVIGVSLITEAIFFNKKN